MHFAFVHGVGPVDFDELLSNGGYAVYIVRVKGYDTCAEDIGDVAQRGVFRTLERQFTRKALLCFDACFNSRHNESVPRERVA